jgi:hypothetical protein
MRTQKRAKGSSGFHGDARRARFASRSSAVIVLCGDEVSEEVQRGPVGVAYEFFAELCDDSIRDSSNDLLFELVHEVVVLSSVS